ncbi:MAG: response regulator transcription factor [Alphaproteobacteria bacterium]|nr:response regulator transcription factor [Alphaproteobacteria bacterium]MBQ6012348.1 response regulator transcription factor [Alphaproteobacteria bacterium]
MTKSILIIDDDDMLRNTLAVGLRKLDFDAITASSAEQASKILERISVDAIVLDRMMEGQDGLSFLKKLRSDNNNTPVLILTAMSGPENAIDGLSGGANDYMSKPFKLQELVLRLNNIIKNRPVAPDDSTVLTGLIFNGEDFFVLNKPGKKQVLPLSKEEKKLLHGLTNPVGNTVSATPMVVKRLRNKINGVLSDINIVTVRGTGYKIIKTKI